MEAINNGHRIRRFGVFEIDLRTRELRKHGIRVHLQEQPFQVLALLLERRGDLVTREELLQKLWPERAVMNCDRSLNKAVRKLRSALGDLRKCPAMWKRCIGAVTGFWHQSGFRRPHLDYLFESEDAGWPEAKGQGWKSTPRASPAGIASRRDPSSTARLPRPPKNLELPGMSAGGTLAF